MASLTTWVTRHGVMRAMLGYAARRGEPQARLMIDREVRRHPYGVYDEVRRSGPLHRGRATWITARHDVASAVLRSEVFRVGLDVSDVPWFMRGTVARGTEQRLLFDPIVPPSLLASNPPDHTRYRRLVAKVFTPRAIAALEPRVEQVAHDLLEDLADRGVVDLVGTYASLLPVTVIAEILGVPLAMRDSFLRWGNAAAPALDVGLSYREYRSVEGGLAAVSHWLVGHIRRLRTDPGDDLLSQLVHTEDGGERLDDRELLATAGLLLAAGFETTVNLLGSGTHLLLTHPEQRERLAAEPGLWPNAVDEILRFESPVQNTARLAREATEVAGVPIPAKGFVAVLIGGANRDPAVFDDPGTFDVGRRNARDHLAFSAGLHYCLGAALARSEGRIGLQALFERYPGLALAGRTVRRPTRTLRGLQALPVLPSERVGIPAPAWM